MQQPPMMQGGYPQQQPMQGGYPQQQPMQSGYPQQQPGMVPMQQPGMVPMGQQPMTQQPMMMPMQTNGTATATNVSNVPKQEIEMIQAPIQPPPDSNSAAKAGCCACMGASGGIVLGILCCIGICCVLPIVLIVMSLDNAVTSISKVKISSGIDKEQFQMSIANSPITNELINKDRDSDDQRWSFNFECWGDDLETDTDDMKIKELIKITAETDSAEFVNCFESTGNGESMGAFEGGKVAVVHSYKEVLKLSKDKSYKHKNGPNAQIGPGESFTVKTQPSDDLQVFGDTTTVGWNRGFKCKDQSIYDVKRRDPPTPKLLPCSDKMAKIVKNWDTNGDLKLSKREVCAGYEVDLQGQECDLYYGIIQNVDVASCNKKKEYKVIPDYKAEDCQKWCSQQTKKKKSEKITCCNFHVPSQDCTFQQADAGEEIMEYLQSEDGDLNNAYLEFYQG